MNCLCLHWIRLLILLFLAPANRDTAPIKLQYWHCQCINPEPRLHKHPWQLQSPPLPPICSIRPYYPAPPAYFLPADQRGQTIRKQQFTCRQMKQQQLYRTALSAACPYALKHNGAFKLCWEERCYHFCGNSAIRWMTEKL